MRTDYTLFEANHIQRAIRYRMARLNGVFWGIVLVTMGAALLSRALIHVGPVALASGVGGLMLIAIGVGWWHRALSRTVWCVKVVSDAVVGYDCARRKTVFSWCNVRRIDLTDEALWIVQSPYHVMTISTSFDDFSALSHQILKGAEDHGIPLYIDGQSLDEMDVYVLCPFLTKEPPTGAAGPSM